MKNIILMLLLASSMVACSKNEVPYDPPTAAIDPSCSSNPKKWNINDLPLTIYVPSELSQFTQNITDAANVWSTAIGRPAFTIISNDASCTGANPSPSCKPNTQWTTTEASLHDNYFGLFKMLTWFDSIGTGVLAFTGTLTNCSTSTIIHADILFNFKNYSFMNIVNDPNHITPQEGGSVDFQSVLTHEMGHFLGLNHIATSEDGSSIMNPSLTKGTKKRSLSPNDSVRLKTLYNLE